MKNLVKFLNIVTSVLAGVLIGMGAVCLFSGTEYILNGILTLGMGLMLEAGNVYQTIKNCMR